VAIADLIKLDLSFSATVLCKRASSLEFAAGRRVNRAGYITN
jgi:hypothetical protein